jgi:hypothetical protein
MQWFAAVKHEGDVGFATTFLPDVCTRVAHRSGNKFSCLDKSTRHLHMTDPIRCQELSIETTLV